MGHLKKYFWRDPDPLWRWASGQCARRWWKHPAVHTLFGAIFILLAVGIVIVFCLRTSGELSAGPRGADSQMIPVAGAMVTGGISVYLLLSLFVRSAARPFYLFGKLGGPPMLRELQISAQPREEIIRMLYWGSFRSLLPSLALLYFTEALFLMFAIFLNGIPSDGVLFLMFFWFAIKPPFDCMMNLAISWRLYFKFGQRILAQIVSLTLVILVFPGIGWILARLMARDWQTVCMVIFVCLLGKMTLASRCFKYWNEQWTKELSKNFGDGA